MCTEDGPFTSTHEKIEQKTNFLFLFIFLPPLYLHPQLPPHISLSISLAFLIFPLLLRLLQASHHIRHIYCMHISGVIRLFAMVEVTVHLTQPSFSDGGLLSMARLVFEGSVDAVVCCFRPRQAYRGTDSN